MNEHIRARPLAVTTEDFEQRVTLISVALKVFLAIVTSPYRRAFKLYTWQPLSVIRAANGDRRRLIPLMREWKTDKYAELQSVQVAVSQP